MLNNTINNAILKDIAFGKTIHVKHMFSLKCSGIYMIIVLIIINFVHRIMIVEHIHILITIVLQKKIKMRLQMILAVVIIISVIIHLQYSSLIPALILFQKRFV